MSKLLKIVMIVTLMVGTTFGYASAETTNLYNDVTNEGNVTSHTTTNDSTDNSSTDNTNQNSLEEDNQTDLLEETTNPYARTNASPISTNSARVSTVSSISEANLGLNNILCVILIAFGILLILLAIAILIRLKK